MLLIVKNKKFVIDYEGYSNGIIKEFSIYDMQTKSVQNFFIKTIKPKNKKSYNWLVKYYHHIPYSYGQTKFVDIIKILNQPNSIFYIKGEEKRKIIQKYTKNLIFNLENIQCPSISSLLEPTIHLCSFHFNKPTIHCAYHKVHKIVNWLNEQQHYIRA